MKEIFKYLPLTTMFIIFLYCCGSLYLVAYWGTFEIDISNLVSLTEIPKSFIMPFFISNSVFVFYLTFNILTSTSDLIRQEKYELVTTHTPPSWKKFFKLLFSFGTLSVLAVGVAIQMYNRFHMRPAYWTGFGCLISMCFAYSFSRHPFFVVKFSYPAIRQYFFIVFFFTIIMSFCIGKSAALKIYTNKEIKYITINASMSTIQKKDSLSMKFLGFLGDKAIISSLDNKRIVFLNQGDINGFKLENRDTTKTKGVEEILLP